MSREDGSIFIETLIAAAIVALVLGMSFNTLADVAARSRMAEARRTALLLAQSKLAAVGAEIPLAEGGSGIESGLVWRVTTQRTQEGFQTSAAGPLYSVSVSVAPQAGGAPLASLRTMRLAGG
ncbi:MAG: hypothetical protein ACXW3D_00805 [Caulobacteraceae bacterium]